jgi:ankyrin repeat protein
MPESLQDLESLYFAVLKEASRKRQEAVVTLLLAQNADSKDGNGLTPLCLAMHNWHWDIVKLLLARNDVNASSKDGNGRTLLSWAAQNGNEEIVKLPLARDNISANSKDKSHQTPLWYAVLQSHQQIVELLLTRNDIDAELKDRNGRTLLLLAVQNMLVLRDRWAQKKGEATVISARQRRC